jgi:hypothetical protein
MLSVVPERSVRVQGSIGAASRLLARKKNPRFVGRVERVLRVRLQLPLRLRRPRRRQLGNRGCCAKMRQTKAKIHFCVQQPSNLIVADYLQAWEWWKTVCWQRPQVQSLRGGTGNFLLIFKRHQLLNQKFIRFVQMCPERHCETLPTKFAAGQRRWMPTFWEPELNASRQIVIILNFMFKSKNCEF